MQSGKSTKRVGVSTSLKAGYTWVTKRETTPDSPPPSRGLSWVPAPVTGPRPPCSRARTMPHPWSPLWRGPALPCVPDGDAHSGAACPKPHSSSAMGPGLNPGSPPRSPGASMRCGPGLSSWGPACLPPPPTVAGPPLGLRVSDEGVLRQLVPGPGTV